MKDFKDKNVKLKIEEFQKRTKRKMTLHILSSNKKDCMSLIEFLTNTKNFF